MRNIKLTIEYDGARYNGWQKLGDTENTIQSKLENVLSQMTNKKNIDVVASGRTDAGVHALAQIVNFKTNINMSTKEMRRYCNQYLPKDIVVKSIEEVNERFHARYNAKSKKYLYRIRIGATPTVFDRKYTYYVPEFLDLEAMKKASSYFLGEHDFKAFSSVKSKKKSTVREMFEIDITKEEKEVHIMFHGTGFLHNMARIMIGTLIEIGEGKRESASIKDILASKVRENAGVTAPAQGLFLYEVFYK